MTTPTLTPQVDVRRADERFKTRINWLDSKHSFSFSHHSTSGAAGLVEAVPSAAAAQAGVAGGVGQDSVDLPRRAVRVVHPHLVLHRAAAAGGVLGHRRQARPGQHLHAQVVQRAGHAGAGPAGRNHGGPGGRCY